MLFVIHLGRASIATCVVKPSSLANWFLEGFGLMLFSMLIN